ncbi:thiamine pyrophosphate-binding protein [Streptomyces sp. XM83C]|jgi:acetolactate synthase-1/2/3 large subunit|uniref:Thiamine pyrophosphate-binding protein n=1 Tax=Streptomyces thermocoprophilus TaxID=78356 RepID=A0ABV5VJ07_9ACTN|nr:thiamine pyrophosphate-binding protein [Streptomyces sp. XM83C]MCK1820287.1 thiamine pyrophosphate-binding protein [Streptomyces sp. XM83C]
MTTPTTHHTAWAAVADWLRHQGTTTVYGLPGDDMDLLGALEDTPVRMVLCRDQRNAVHMATGHALASGRLAVCTVGKGPAVTNTLTGLLEASSSAAPVLLVAGGTGLDRVGTGAFQELDQLAAVRPFTKHAERVDRPERLPAALEKAALTAVNGTPGPVYLEIPDHIAQLPVTVAAPWRTAAPHRLAPDPDALEQSARLIAAARRPLLLVGGGARHRNHDRSVERLAGLLGAALFTTASGRGTLDEDHPLHCGVSGLYTVEPAARLWEETDLVIALGSRLEETATFGWPDRAGLPVVQVVAAEDSVVTGTPGMHVLGDVARTVDAWTGLLDGHRPDEKWAERIRDVRRLLAERAARRAADAEAAVPGGGPTVAQVLTALDRAVPADRVLVQENGLQDMWSYYYPHWSCGTAGGSVVPSEQTPLGFGAAAAVGVKLASGDRPVAAVCGDGAFHLFRAELPTVADAGAAVLYIVLDNGGYGWLQTNLDRVSGPGSRFAFTADRPTGNAALARAHGLGHWSVTTPDALEPALREAWECCARGTSAVVEVRVALADQPPGMAGAAGDFPVREDQ